MNACAPAGHGELACDGNRSSGADGDVFGGQGLKESGGYRDVGAGLKALVGRKARGDGDGGLVAGEVTGRCVFSGGVDLAWSGNRISPGNGPCHSSAVPIGESGVKPMDWLAVLISSVAACAVGVDRGDPRRNGKG